MTINTGNTIRILRVGDTATSTLSINSGGTLTHSSASFVGALVGSNGRVNVSALQEVSGVEPMAALCRLEA